MFFGGHSVFHLNFQQPQKSKLVIRAEKVTDV